MRFVKSWLDASFAMRTVYATPHSVYQNYWKIRILRKLAMAPTVAFDTIGYLSNASLFRIVDHTIPLKTRTSITYQPATANGD